jgi:hypothetical protein
VATLTYDEIQQMLRRLAAGETTIETEGRRHTLRELGDTLRMTRGMLQAIPMAWSDAQVNFQPPAPPEAEQAAPDVADAGGKLATGMAAAGGGNAAGEGDRWSASEALTHLLATQNWYLLHMTRLVGRREHFDRMPRGLGDQARQGVAASQLASELRDATARMLTEIDTIAPTADLEATRDSIFFGALSQRGWVMLAVIHDAQHFEQIQRLARLPGFPRE